MNGLVRVMMSLLVAAIVGVAVVIPVIQDQIAQLSGDLGVVLTVLNLLPLFVGLMLLVVFARPLGA